MIKHRIQLDFTENTYQKMIKLREKAECESNAALVRKAFRILEYHLDRKDKGYKFLIEKPDGTLMEVEL